jgi:hypothetical protein
MTRQALQKVIRSILRPPSLGIRGTRFDTIILPEDRGRVLRTNAQIAPRLFKYRPEKGFVNWHLPSPRSDRWRVAELALPEHKTQGRVLTRRTDPPLPLSVQRTHAHLATDSPGSRGGGDRIILIISDSGRFCCKSRLHLMDARQSFG